MSQKTASLVAALAAGCTLSSSYVPDNDRDHRVRLVAERGALALRKDGQVAPIESSAGPVTSLMGCDEHARAMAASAEDELRTGNTLAVVGALGIVLLPPVGILIASIGAQHTLEGQVMAVDAMNRHNDAPACAAERDR